MSEHQCEWKETYQSDRDHYRVDYLQFRCSVCNKMMLPEEIERRLNATEAFPAKKARTAASLIRGHTVKHLVAEYADILEGE